MTEPILKVMIVDDSATARRILSDIVERGPQMKVVAAVSDPFEAVEYLKRDTADVMVLDVQMPRMDGVTFLKKLMNLRPMPVVMCSSFTEKGSPLWLECLEQGAVDIIAKPRIATKQDMLDLEARIHYTLRSAAAARYRSSRGSALTPHKPDPQPSSFRTTPKLTADEILPPPSLNQVAKIPSTPKLLAIGASTGGTEAIRKFLETLPIDCPGIVITQHMPEHFTAQFAKRLNELSKIEVREAQNGDIIKPGLALVAPGSHHMIVKRTATHYRVEIVDGPLVSRHRPSVDALFRSVAVAAGKNAIGIIMTGMGDDGAQGMLEMKQAGAHNFAQDKDSCVVFGMPNQAIKKGGVDQVLPLSQLAAECLKKARS